MGAVTPGRRVGYTFCMRTAIVLVFGTLLASVAGAANPTPTPGPASRAGSVIDQTLNTVEDHVAQALLLARVRISLLQHLKDDGLHVQIVVKGSTVELSGRVAKRSSRELAEKVALSVSGVREVHNRIAFGPEGGQGQPPVADVVGKVERKLGDALLEARVKASLFEEVGKVGFDIEVEATDGVVSLSGTVPDSARQKLAVSVAKATKGVKELHDFLRVKQ
jgi:hyperosmotically inducible protein